MQITEEEQRIADKILDLLATHRSREIDLWIRVGRLVQRQLGLSLRRYGVPWLKKLSAATGEHKSWLSRCAAVSTEYGSRPDRLITIPGVSLKDAHMLSRVVAEHRREAEEILRKQKVTADQLKEILESRYGRAALYDHRLGGLE